MFLCQKLGWRSLDAMRKGMPASEFLLWNRWFDKQAQEQELAALKAGG